jgi:ribosomal protein L18
VGVKHVFVNGVQALKNGEHVYAQVIDDNSGRTLAAASTIERSLVGKDKAAANKTTAGQVGKAIAERLLAKKLERVVFDRGGIDHSFHVLVAKLPKGAAKPTMVWRALGHPFKDYAAFLDALRNGKLDDRLDYGR